MPMRALALLCLVSLAGCVGSARHEGFTPTGPALFLYSAQTNTVMTANDDGVAERLRRDWIADAVQAHAMCPRAMSSTPGGSCPTRSAASPMAATSSMPGAAWNSRSRCGCRKRSSAASGARPALLPRAPAFQQWPCIAGDRIAPGKRHQRDLGGGAVVSGRLGLADIGPLAARIGADHQQVAARRLALVRDAGRDHDDIAGRADRRSARPRRRAAPGRCRGRCRAPRARCCDNGGARRCRCARNRASRCVANICLAGGGAVAAVRQRAAIDDERQRAVRHDAVIGEAIGFDFDGLAARRSSAHLRPADCGHIR